MVKALKISLTRIFNHINTFCFLFNTLIRISLKRPGLSLLTQQNMNKTTKYKWLNNNLIFEIEDTLNLNVFLEANNILLSNSRFDKMNFQAFNLLNVKNIDLTVPEIRVFLTLLEKAMIWNKTVKTAIISSDPKLVSYFEMFLNEFRWTSLNCKIFETLDSALDWCEIENEFK
ncbi:MAG TPA: hypothetical protein DCG75_18455 [Bacteroidales bacterium]|nr:hypothetical protein [Bacteroidales bacterium]